jgi:hypothetical protein
MDEMDEMDEMDRSTDSLIHFRIITEKRIRSLLHLITILSISNDNISH